MDVVGIRGPRIRLVPIDRDAHIDNFLRWFNDPEVTRWLARDWPMTRLGEEKWIDRISVSETDLTWAVLDETGRHIGSTGVHRIDWRSRSAGTGTVIGEKDAWGKGYGTEIMRVRSTWAFENAGLNRLASECFAGNLASARCLEKVGYRRIGIARQRYFRGGRWHDCILWDYLAEEYFAGRELEGA